MAKTGLVAITYAIMHICRILEAWDLKARAALAAAKTGGTITEAEYDIAIAFLNSTGAACFVFRKVTGY